MKLEKIQYSTLNAKQKEAYNFQKLSGILADYGFVTIRLSNDWQSADFIAQHIDGTRFLKVQLKGRLYFSKAYEGKDIYVAFPDGGAWYLYPHDEALSLILNKTNIASTRSWMEGGVYHFPEISVDIRAIMEDYRIR
jgi:hypothetical protein